MFEKFSGNKKFLRKFWKNYGKGNLSEFQEIKKNFEEYLGKFSKDFWNVSEKFEGLCNSIISLKI